MGYHPDKKDRLEAARESFLAGRDTAIVYAARLRCLGLRSSEIADELSSLPATKMRTHDDARLDWSRDWVRKYLRR